MRMPLPRSWCSPSAVRRASALSLIHISATEYESAAYVMKDLEFEDDSIVETKYVIAGGSQTITVTDGQYVELFAAVMEPMNP